METKETDDPLEMMQRAAAGAGVRVEISGTRPQQPQIDKLFCQAALETLTNAVRHAEATVLQIELAENNDSCTACYSNNGRLPEGELVEGGGLGSLRRKVENQGGSMFISCAPEFALTITVPKDWSEIP
jgi:signal transduction histidine kinase